MARCDEGYLCEVCGDEVPSIVESDLYLRYVLGEVAPGELSAAPERHLRCNPTLAQFIVDERFPPVVVDGPFGKAELDPTFAASEEARVSAAYRRLREVVRQNRPIAEYPLTGPSADSAHGSNGSRG